MADIPALHLCQQQVKRSIEKGDKDGELVAQDNLGQLYLSLGQFPESIECHKKLASIAIELGRLIPEGRAYYKIAHSNSSMHNNVEAIKYYHKCLSVLKERGDDKIERMAFCNLGIQYFVIGDNTESIKYLETSLSMAIKAADRYVEDKACYNLGNTNMALGCYKKAISYYERALCIMQEMGDLEFAEKTTSLLGDAYQACEKYEEARKYHKQSLQYAIQNKNNNLEKKAYLSLGSDSNSLRDYANAEEYFKKYQNIANLTEDKTSEVDAYRFLGIAYFELGRNDEALECHQNSLSIAIEINYKQGVEYAHSNVAIAYHKLGKYQQAIDWYEKSLNFAVKNKNRNEESKLLENLGNSQVDLGNYQKGIEYFNKSLVVVREIGDRGGEHLYVNIGEAYNLLGNYKEAMKYHEKFLKFSSEMGDKDSEQKAINQLGVIYGKLNYHEKAIECLEQQLRTAVDNGDKTAEASLSCNLGNVYVAVGRYEEAFHLLQKSLRIALETNDVRLQGTAHLNIAHAHSVLANRREEINHCKMSAEISLKSGDRKSEAMAYRILVSICNKNKDYITMMEYAKKQLDVVEHIGDKYEQVFAYQDIGRASFLVGQYKNAKKYLEQSLNIAKEIGDRKSQGVAYEYLGYVSENVSKEEALEFYEKHLQLSKEIGDKSGVGKANRNLGTIFLFSYLNEKSTEYKEKSEHYFKESLRSYDSLFQDLGEEDVHKINVIDTFIYTNKLLVELYIESEELEKALLVSEQERGRALEDILMRKYRLKKMEEPKYDFVGYTDIETKVLSSDTCILFFSEMMKMRRSNFELQVGTWVLDFQTHVSFYRNELQKIKALLEERNLDEEVQESKDILVDLVEKCYQTMSVQRSANCEDRSFNIDVSGAAESVVSNCQVSEKRCAYDEELNENYLEVLYDTLITPVQHRLTDEEIVIIPNGPLFKVPFAALQDPETKSVLSETKRLRIVPSLTTLKILKESSAETHSLSGALIVGDPDVSGNRIFRGKEISLHPLPNARLEAETIATVLGVKAITGTQATKEVIKERLREGVAVIHFAAHGCAGSGEIVLCPSHNQPTEKIPDEDDYILTIKEVQEIGLRARLVVLSCCHSGRGEIKSEGVIGMSRAFLAAGALAVVASLWAVDDEGTLIFMKLFYTHLLNGKTASTSLQQAMKEMRNMPRFKEPMYWAPFVLIGDDVTIEI